MANEPCLVCQGLCCGEIPRLNAKIERMRSALEKIVKHRRHGRKTQGALLAEDSLKEPTATNS